MSKNYRRRQIKRRRGLLAVYQSCKSALEAVRANKLRSLLTSLGIIIGVAAVIVMISTSESNAAAINGRLSALNPDELVVRAGSTNVGGVRGGGGTATSLTQANADAIAAQVSHISAISPIANVSGQVIFQSENWSTSIQGVYPAYQQLGSWQMQEGSFIGDSDEQSATAVAVVGQTVVDNLFTPAGVDPLGQQIRIRNVPFTIVGVLDAKGASASSFSDPDDVVYVPFSTAQERLTGTSSVNSIDILADNSTDLNSVQAATEQLLEQLHGITNSADDDFTIQKIRLRSCRPHRLPLSRSRCY